MLERVSRQPALTFNHVRGVRDHDSIAAPLAWAATVEAVSLGDQVALVSVDRALHSAVTAKRWPGENDAAACARLMRQDRDVRVLLKARGEMVGREIELPDFEDTELIPVAALATSKTETDPFVLEARTSLRVYIGAHRLTGRELLSDVKRRLAAANDPEFRRLTEAYEVAQGKLK